MAEQIRKKRTATKTEETVAEETPAAVDERQKHLDDIDAMLDEIDEVLESEAETFVKDFIQKGGQRARNVVRALTDALISPIVDIWTMVSVPITTRRWL